MTCYHSTARLKIRWYSKRCTSQIIIQSWRQKVFPVKGLIGNILGFASHKVSIATTHLPLQCENTHRQEWTDGCGCVTIKLYLETQPSGWIWLTGHSVQLCDLASHQLSDFTPSSSPSLACSTVHPSSRHGQLFCSSNLWRLFPSQDFAFAKPPARNIVAPRLISPFPAGIRSNVFSKKPP